MTWNEFKQLVDQRLAEQGSDGDIEIYYIDVTDPARQIDVEVGSYGDRKFELTISD